LLLLLLQLLLLQQPSQWVLCSKGNFVAANLGSETKGVGWGGGLNVSIMNNVRWNQRAGCMHVGPGLAPSEAHSRHACWACMARAYLQHIWCNVCYIIMHTWVRPTFRSLPAQYSACTFYSTCRCMLRGVPQACA